MSVPTHSHWSEQLADRILAEKKPPYAITSGMTTSGPAHFGTVCEFLFPFAIREALRRKGQDAAFYLVADILDAFDRIPLPMERYRLQLQPHLGKPLCDVPDPTGQSRSFGDHYLDEVRRLMGQLGVDCNVLRANDLYDQGKFDGWARFYLQHEAQARYLIEKSSGRTLPEDFSVVMPICARCGKIATTRVLSHDADSYVYACDRDVNYTKGCGFRGENKIAEHRYKIVWRLHWPAWKQVLGTTIEGAGVDHATRGGSEDTCRAVTLELMQRDYHIPYRYGFILLEGKKYSKSKGLGLGVTELLKLMPPEILKYLLLRPDLEENIDINPTPENLLRAFEEFQQAAALAARNPEGLSRSDLKRAIAFGLSIDRTRWKAPFLDVLLYYQVYLDWEKVAAQLNDPEGVAYLRPYVEEWIRRDFIQEDYRFKYQPRKAQGAIREFVASLGETMDALAIHNAVFGFAKGHGIEPEELFRQLYLAILGKERGPRLGKLIFAIGVGRLKGDLL